MLPIRDHNPSASRPYVTWGLMLANMAVFLLTLSIAQNDAALGRLYGAYAMIPARLGGGEGYYTILTSMFMHGGWLHLGGNLLFLWIFGDNLEDRMGHLPYLLFYLVCGAGADMAEYLAAPLSPYPVIGASGAIAGVMGGYLLLFPRARVDVVVFFVIFFRIFQMPAWVMLGLWFAFEFFSGIGTVSADVGIAHWAHAGGFVVGVVLAAPLWFRRGQPERRDHLSRTNVPSVRRRDERR